MKSTKSTLNGKGGDTQSAAKASNANIAAAMGKQMKQDGQPWNKGVFTKPLPAVKNIKKIKE